MAAKLTPRKLKAVEMSTPTYSTVVLPDGRELSKGMVVTVDGEPGVFKFMYARLGEITVFGGSIAGEKSDHCWRTFRPEQIAKAGANTTKVTLEAKAVAAMSTEYALMTPGQKAAHTKRMRLAAAAAASAVA